jgi:hypothetical protein
VSGLEDRLQLDITEALAQVERLDQAFAAVGVTLQQAVDSALTGIEVPDAEIVVTPDTDAVTPAIDDAVLAADSSVEITGDAASLTGDIDSAIETADTEVVVTGDTGELQAAIDALSGEQVDVDVQAPGLEDVQTGHEGAGAAAHSAGESAHGAGGEFAALGIGAKLAGGEVGALQESLHLIPGGALGAAGAIAAVTIAGKELFDQALGARQAQERYNLVLGEFAETVDEINVGGLNESLDTLSVRLGATGKELEDAASKIFTIGKAGGVAGPQIATTTENIIALAARAVALNPALGNVGDVAERLFGGLARGGRFAANFGISLTSAEISARALADTGKSATSQLTLYEKAAAGAAIATERLGDHLAEDVNAGAENVALKLASVKARFEEALETLGQPLLDPVINTITAAEPALESLAGLFAELFTAVAPLIESLAGGLVPAIDALITPFEILIDILGPIASALGALPDFLTAGAVAAGLAAVAISRLAASTGLLASTAGLAGVSLGGLVAFLPTIALAVGAVVTVMQLLDKHTKEVNKDAQDLLVVPAQNALDAASSFEEVDAVIGRIKGGVDELNRAASAKTGGPLGFFRQVDAADLKVGADALFQMEVNATRLTIRAKELQRELGLTDEEALALARSGEEVGDRFNEATGEFDNGTDAVQRQTAALQDYIAQVQAGTFTQDDWAEALARTGLTADDLGSALEDARKPITDFVNDIVGGLPGISTAFDSLEEGNVKLDTFLDRAEQSIADSAAFLGNIQQLIDRGAVALAESLVTLNSQDPVKAAQLTKEAVKLSADALDEANRRVQAVDFGQGLVTSAATKIAEETRGGGIDLAVDEIRKRFGERLALIPGQLDNSGEVKEAGEGIAQSSVNAVLGAAAFDDFPDGMREIGEEGARGFFEGVALDPEFAAERVKTLYVDPILNTLRKAFEIHSPSQVTKDIGSLVAQGFIVGLADIEGAADAIDPIIDVMDQFKLTAVDVANVAGDNIATITKNLHDLGVEQDKLTPDKLRAVGDAVKALGGKEGVKDLQNAILKSTVAAFGGLGGKEISAIVDQINTAAALQRGAGIFGVTPALPTPGETNVVKGGDVFARDRGITVAQAITVTPPPDATSAEIAGEIAIASQWAFAGVSG